MCKINKKEMKEIFIELKTNRKIALEKLYKKYSKLIYNIAFSILKNKEDSEETMQNVFSKLCEITNDKLPTSKEASWIYSLTKNEAITLLRKRENNIDLENIYEIEDNDNEINDIIDKEKFNKMIDSLNEKEKQIISLKILSDLSFDEISKLLNEPVGTIKWRYYKSTHTLQIILGNLSIFVIAFVIGVKNLFTNTKTSLPTESEKEEISRGEEKKTDSYMEDSKGIAIEDKESNNEIKQEVVIPNESLEKNINYFGVGILSISSVFLIITIIITIFFAKHQLKPKSKTSK